MKILNYGSCCIDNVYTVEQFVQPGETIAARQFNIYPGGKGLNQSIALAQAGATVLHAGKVGKDGDWLRELLLERGVNVDHLRVVDGPSGHANIQVNGDGENTIIIVGGTNREITPADFDTVFASTEPGDFLLLQNEVSHLRDMIEMGSERGLRIVFNAAPMTDDVMNLPLNLIEFLIVNETEAASLTESPSHEPSELITRLLEKCANTTVVLTLGEDGAIVANKQQQWQCSAFPAQVLDTTGAGDTFTGFFLSAISKGLPMDTCLQQGCKAASLSVTRSGAATSIPRLEEI